MIVSKALLALAEAAAKKHAEAEDARTRIPAGSMRVAPNTDAVVWRINSDKCGEL